MAKSRRFQPGDSAPDFSHLAGHDAESDEPEWTAEGEAGSSGDAAADDPPAEPVLPADPPAVPAADSHVFFEGDEPLSPEALLGETKALRSDEVGDPTGEADVASASGSLFDDADDEDTRLNVSAENATQLTDVGIPAFVDPPPAGEPEDEGDAAEEGAIPFSPPAEERAAAAPAAGGTAAAAVGAGSAAKKPRQRTRSTPRPQRAEPAAAPAENDRQRLLLILLASYASAITIAFVWLWLARNNARPHELESLPDVAPLGPNEFRYAPQNASMPRGHTLPLGGGQQLGYIKVEPLRVTRGPVTFTHYSDAAQTKPPTPPVLKLWLRFTNVSSDQLIAPLDAGLLLTRDYQVESDTMLANQLLLPADKTSQKPAYVIDHPTTSEWDLAGQKLGQRLKPGESLETYIPLEPGSEAHLTGDLLWRVHLRKGYHDGTGHGVTTMIEVPFSTADVQIESATPT